MTIAKTGEAGLLKSGSIFRRQIFIPIAALLALVLFNLITDPSFFEINYSLNSAGDPVLSGYLITILDNASELAILAIGMTLVVSASAGTDISVGSVMSLAASFCCMLLAGYGVSSTTDLAVPLAVGVIGGILMGCICGAFNGALVAYLNIQPMVATLILWTAARAIGLLVCNNLIVYVRNDAFAMCGPYRSGFFLQWNGDLEVCSFMSWCHSRPFELGFRAAWDDLLEKLASVTVPEKCLSCGMTRFCSACPGVRFAETGRPDGIPQRLCDNAREWMYRARMAHGKLGGHHEQAV